MLLLLLLLYRGDLGEIDGGIWSTLYEYTYKRVYSTGDKDLGNGSSTFVVYEIGFELVVYTLLPIVNRRSFPTQKEIA
jgi:hypothetical protein